LSLSLVDILFGEVATANETKLIRLVVERSITLWVPFEQILLFPTLFKNIVFVLTFLYKHQFTTYVSISGIAMTMFEFLVLDTLDTFVDSERERTKPHELWKYVFDFDRYISDFIVQYFIEQLSIEMI